MKRIFTPLLALCALVSQAQFTTTTGVTGTGASGNPWILATATQNQSGGVWRTNAVNLANDFTAHAKLNFGNITTPGNGADGIAFVMLNGANYASVTNTTLGAQGGGMGYVGLDNSLAFEMDTWENHEQNYMLNGHTYNFNDPVSDHAAFMLNGDPHHYVLPTSLVGEVEDGAWHNIDISWNHTLKTLSISFNGQSFSYTYPGAAPASAFIGFTAATGLSYNLHQVQEFVLDVQQPCTLTVSAELPALGCRTNTIYIGYGPTSVTATSNQDGTTFVWYNAADNSQVATGATFTPSAVGSYYVVGTNGSCTASTAGTVNVISVVDVRCSAGKSGKMDKVYVCHKPFGNGHVAEDPNTLCVAPSAVQAHLDHGDCLGRCEDMPTFRTGNPSTTIISTTDEPTQLEGLIAYPNPSRGNLTLNLKGVTADNIQIVNARGMTVQNITPGAVNSINLNLSRYGAGVYLIRVVSGKSVQTTKIIVE